MSRHATRYWRSWRGARPPLGVGQPLAHSGVMIIARFELPLLLCTPSLALAAEQADQRYLLLDRDERFSFLSAFRAFDLDRPFRLDQPFDAIFCARSAGALWVCNYASCAVWSRAVQATHRLPTLSC